MLSSTKVNVNDKVFSIQQVSDMTGVTPRQLRYWEKYDIVNPDKVKRGRRRDRRYSLRDIVIIKKISKLRAQSMSVKKIAEILENTGMDFEEVALREERRLQEEREGIIKEGLRLLKKNLKEKEKRLRQGEIKVADKEGEYVKIITKMEQIEFIEKSL